MKTFLNLSEEKLGTLFRELDTYPALCSFVVQGVPRAIAAFLRVKMNETGESKVSYTLRTGDGELCTFSLLENKRGDGIAYTPEFELGKAGLSVISSDTVKFDTVDINDIAYYIVNSEDGKDMIEALKRGFAGDNFGNGKWTECDPNGDPDHPTGLLFDECGDQDIAMLLASEIALIFEILTNNKEDDDTITYEVDGLGTFSVTSVRDGYNVTLDFDKGYKNMCKYDKMAEAN